MLRARGLASIDHAQLSRAAPVRQLPAEPWSQRRELGMQRVEDNEEIIERVAAIDVGKSELVVCIRVPIRASQGAAGRRSFTARR